MLELSTAGGTQNSNGPSNAASTFLTGLLQRDLEMISNGVSGPVYEVDENTVLKTCNLYVPPSESSIRANLWFYAAETVSDFENLENERAMLRLLAENPHPNIAEAIEVDYPEGIYLRNYRQASELGPIYQSDRILWYQNILRALLHLHELGFAHSEIQPHAILFDANGYALLSDFSASRPFEHPNPSLPVLTNGASETVSDATDRFAMASMIYEMETGCRTKIRVDRVKGLILPEIETGNDGLDSLIENAWRGLFSSTQAMLEYAERLSDLRNDRKSAADLVSKTELQRQLSSWRNNRIKEHVMSFFFGRYCSYDLLNLLPGRILFSWMTDREAHIKFLQSLMSIE